MLILMVVLNVWIMIIAKFVSSYDIMGILSHPNIFSIVGKKILSLVFLKAQNAKNQQGPQDLKAEAECALFEMNRTLL